MNHIGNGGNKSGGGGDGKKGKYGCDKKNPVALKGPIHIIQPVKLKNGISTVKIEGDAECGSMHINGNLEIHGIAAALNTVSAARVVTRSVKAPYIEGVLINRFVNNTGFELVRGDVVALTIAPSICPGKTEEATLVLEAVDLRRAVGHKFAGVVVGNNANGEVGFDEVPEKETGFVCVGGIYPMVKVDRANFYIDDGEHLIVGPKMSALPEASAAPLHLCSVYLGFCLCCPEPEDRYAPVFIQPGRQIC